MQSLMRSSNYKKPDSMFITDLDGTLLTDDQTITVQDLEKLASLKSKNIVTTIATGRSLYSFKKIMRELGFLSSMSPLAIDYVIFSTGTGIMEFPSCNILNSFSLAADEVVSVGGYLEKQQLDYMVQKPVPDTNHFTYSCHGSHNPDFHARIALYDGFATPINADSLANFGRATQIICIVPQEDGDRVTAQITSKFQHLNVIKATSPLDKKSIWIEIFSPEVSKSQAAAWLAENLGLDSANICAVGNDYNDEDLLHWAGAGFLTENGPESLKERFYTVASNNNGGVSEAASCWTEILAV